MSVHLDSGARSSWVPGRKIIETLQFSFIQLFLFHKLSQILRFVHNLQNEFGFQYKTPMLQSNALKERVYVKLAEGYCAKLLC